MPTVGGGIWILDILEKIKKQIISAKILNGRYSWYRMFLGNNVRNKFSILAYLALAVFWKGEMAVLLKAGSYAMEDGRLGKLNRKTSS